MFKKFKKIENIDKCHMKITQKMHGTHAAIYIDPDTKEIKCYSRTRELTLTDDNHGFAKFISERKEEILSHFRKGDHYGELCGTGINSGEGLTEHAWFVFNGRYEGSLSHINIEEVPVLYDGAPDTSMIKSSMNILKTFGSQAMFRGKMLDHFKDVEGIIIQIGGQRWKKTFTPEETLWNKPRKKLKEKIERVDVSHLLHPIRLEKLLSRDDKYTKGYPNTIASIIKDYIKDLEDEGYIIDKLIKKSLGSSVFEMIRSEFDSKYLKNESFTNAQIYVANNNLKEFELQSDEDFLVRAEINRKLSSF